MARPLVLSRTEAEFLIDLIEKSGAFQYLADELRTQWGMKPRLTESEQMLSFGMQHRSHHGNDETGGSREADATGIAPTPA